MKNQLIQSQKQLQTASIEMQRSLNILSLGAESLRERVERALSENPLLEWESGSNDQEAHEALIMNAAAPKDELSELVRMQIAVQGGDPRLVRAAERIVICLDDDGYVRMSLDALAGMLGLIKEEARAALRLVQSCEPRGVGARTLRECLLLQVAGRDRVSMLARELIKFHLAEVAAGTAKAEGYTKEELSAALACIRSLDPKPGLRYGRGTQAEYAVPDLIVEQSEEGLEVRLINQPALPTLSAAASVYRREGDEEARIYTERRLTEARTLISAIRLRGETLLAAGLAIAEEQRDFFLSGTPPNHFTLRMLASAIGRNPSTACRAVQGKYLLFQGKSYPLRYFFPAATASGQSGLAVKDAIRRLVAEEPAGRGLSDARISVLLKERGLYAARRTVAKYRMEMQIPASGKRG